MLGGGLCRSPPEQRPRDLAAEPAPEQGGGGSASLPWKGPGSGERERTLSDIVKDSTQENTSDLVLAGGLGAQHRGS